MNEALLPLKAIREKLEAKGLSEAEIEKVLNITKDTQNIIAKAKSSSRLVKETKVIASMLIRDHCPACQRDDSHLAYGYYYKGSGQTRFVVDQDLPLEDVKGCKQVKEVKNYRMCQTCMNKEHMMNKLAIILDEPKNHPKVAKFIKELGS